jgi:hypothetical protein
VKSKIIFLSIILVLFFLVSCNQQNQVKENYSLQVGSNIVLIDGKEFELNAPVIEVNGSAYLPLRFFAERFKAENLEYDVKTEKITFSLIKTISEQTKSANESGEIKSDIINKVDVEKTKEEKVVYPTVNALDLFASYKDNQIKADQTYKNKVYDIKGVIEDIGKDIMDRPFISLGKEGGFGLGVTQCLFDNKYLDELTKLNKGDSITIRGRINGYLVNVIVEGCILVK